MIEEWRAVAGYGGKYQVSCRGRVKMLFPKRLIFKTAALAWYPSVGLRHDGVCRTHSVHRLVCEAFIGPKPKGWHTRHLNGDPTDNRAENLVYGTPKENQADRLRHGRGAKKLTPADILKIRRLLANGALLQREIGKMFSVTSGQISSIKTGRTWSHLGETQ